MLGPVREKRTHAPPPKKQAMIPTPYVTRSAILIRSSVLGRATAEPWASALRRSWSRNIPSPTVFILLVHFIGAFHWCILLVHFIAAFYRYILLVHFIGAFYRCILLVHFIGAFYWCILLVHFIGPFYWSILLVHFTGAFYWCILLMHRYRTRKGGEVTCLTLRFTFLWR